MAHPAVTITVTPTSKGWTIEALIHGTGELREISAERGLSKHVVVTANGNRRTLESAFRTIGRTLDWDNDGYLNDQCPKGPVTPNA